LGSKTTDNKPMFSLGAANKLFSQSDEIVSSFKSMLFKMPELYQ
jgi:hypothetical protein